MKTKKDFEQLARWLSGLRMAVEDHGDIVFKCTFDQYVNGSADELYIENPRFDRMRFLRATGWEDPDELQRVE